MNMVDMDKVTKKVYNGSIAMEDNELTNCRVENRKYICILSTDGNNTVYGIFMINDGNNYRTLYLDMKYYGIDRSCYQYIGCDELTTEMELLCLKYDGKYTGVSGYSGYTGSTTFGRSGTAYRNSKWNFNK
jgi:hypothetical protein